MAAYTLARDDYELTKHDGFSSRTWRQKNVQAAVFPLDDNTEDMREIAFFRIFCLSLVLEALTRILIGRRAKSTGRLEKQF